MFWIVNCVKKLNGMLYHIQFKNRNCTKVYGLFLITLKNPKKNPQSQFDTNVTPNNKQWKVYNSFEPMNRISWQKHQPHIKVAIQLIKSCYEYINNTVIGLKIHKKKRKSWYQRLTL